MSNFGWDYPPGVSGNEYEIAGPDKEWEANQTEPCENCLKWVHEDDTVYFESYRGQVSWECAFCHWMNIVEFDEYEPDDYEEDPDYLREMKRDGL
jgi:hypothetical protein